MNALNIFLLLYIGMIKINFWYLLPFLPFIFAEARPLHQENFPNGNSLTCLYEIHSIIVGQWNCAIQYSVMGFEVIPT